MTDRQNPETFRSELLQQDETLHTARYEEHRMKLERQLAQAESREKLAKWIAMGALLTAAAVFPILASGVFGSADPTDDDATVLSIAAGVIYTVAWAIFFIGTASYYSRFLPRVRRAREDLQNESIRELRQEISELRQQIGGATQALKSEQSGPSE